MTLSHWVMSHESYYSDTPKRMWCVTLLVTFVVSFAPYRQLANPLASS